MKGSSTPSTRSLQRAKRALLEKYGDRAWFRGVGIAPKDGGMCLRLNVDSKARLKENEIPAEYQNIAIEVVRTTGYKPRQE